MALTSKFPLKSCRRKTQNLLLYGEAGKGGKTDFIGILGYLKQAVDDSTSETYRDFLLEYMSATECPVCKGKRLRPESLAVKVNGMSIADFTALPVVRALDAAKKIKLTGPRSDHCQPHRV